MKIVPMTNDILLYKCIHSGPLDCSTPETTDNSIAPVSKEQLERNRKFLSQLIDTYGSCAMLAIEENSVVGHVRFYPKFLIDRYEFCCHVAEYSITDEIIKTDLPPIESLDNRTLRINCFLIDKTYRGQGLSGDLITAIVDWAGSNGWKAVSALATHDNYWLSQQMCLPKLSTYQKLGFETKELIVIPEAGEHLKNIEEGKLGPEIQREFEKACEESDPEKLSCLYEVERGIG
ncbi:GNAT family N-acetyltransferase [Candidatus Latescibacterota bacterium]